MSETIIEAPTAEKESALKRFAKAFYAKVKAAKDRLVAFFGENETPVAEESTPRKAARLALAVPKWAGNGATGVLRVLLLTAGSAVGLVAVAAASAILIVFAAVFAAALVVFKVAQFFSLLLRTPYLIVRGDDCLKTDWVGYGNLWKPKYFHFTYISQVFTAQAAEAALKLQQEQEEPVLSVVHDRSKTSPTPKQEKRRPARIPALAGA